MKKLTGVLGGSFNPVHYGHVSLARNIVVAGVVDEVWLSLSPRNPLKDASTLMPDDVRLGRLREALKEVDRVEACDIELSMPVPSYTIEALRKLSQTYGDRKFILIVGADNLEKFTLWKDWESILEEFGIIVYPRGSEVTRLPERLIPWKNHIKLLNDMPLYDISSTQIRSRGQL